MKSNVRNVKIILIDYLFYDLTWNAGISLANEKGAMQMNS